MSFSDKKLSVICRSHRRCCHNVVFSYRITRSSSTNLAQSTLGPREFKCVRKKDHIPFQGRWIGNNEKHHFMTFGGKAGPQMWGKGQNVTWYYIVKIFTNLFTKKQLKLRCMWKHLHVVLILICSNNDPPPPWTGLGHNKGSTFYSFSLCCSGERCDPWTSYLVIFES